MVNSPGQVLQVACSSTVSVSTQLTQRLPAPISNVLCARSWEVSWALHIKGISTILYDYTPLYVFFVCGRAGDPRGVMRRSTKAVQALDWLKVSLSLKLKCRAPQLPPAVLFGQKVGQDRKLVKKVKLWKVLRICLPIVENLSGPQESIFSLSRRPQLHFGKKSKK